MSDLYRREAVEARTAPLLGEMQLLPPRLSSYVAGLALFTAIALFAVSYYGSYVNRIRVVGALVPETGVLILRSPGAGRISTVHISEGDAVSAGDALVTLVSDIRTLSHESAATALDNILKNRLRDVARLRSSEREALDVRLKHLGEQMAMLRIEEDIGLRQVRARSTQEAITRQVANTLESLAEESYVSALQVSERRAAAAASEAEVLAAELQVQTRSRAIQEIELQIQDAQISYERLTAELARQENLLAQERILNNLNAGGVMTASTDGTVSARMVEPGQMVNAGDELIAVVPSGGLMEAHFLVPSRSIAAVRPGRSVVVRFDAFPFERYGHFVGTISRISQSTWSDPDGSSREPGYRVVVALPQQSILTQDGPTRLLPGMRVEADILLERRRLLDWIFAPVKRSSRTFTATGEAELRARAHR